VNKKEAKKTLIYGGLWQRGCQILTMGALQFGTRLHPQTVMAAKAAIRALPAEPTRRFFFEFPIAKTLAKVFCFFFSKKQRFLAVFQTDRTA
jgi:hypothetical protein